eukprot:866523-Pyramimonas_sp.AAC.1
MDALTKRLSRSDMSAASAIQAPCVGSAGNPLSSVNASGAPTPPASENDTNAMRSGSSFQSMIPLEAVP